MFRQFSPIVDNFKIKMLPVIQARTFDAAMVDLKSQRPYKPKLCANGNTGATNSPGVVGNFWLEKYDMEQRFRHGIITHFTRNDIMFRQSVFFEIFSEQKNINLRSTY